MDSPDEPDPPDGPDPEEADGAPDPPPAPPAGARDAGGDDARALAAAAADADPVDALTARARAEIGPLVDRWTALVGDVVAETADSLGAVRAWIDTQGVEALDVAGVSARLGKALVAAELAGRYDIEETPVALASAAHQHVQLPFAEQIEFFRRKLSLPTERWTDIWQSRHGVAFVVAGAAREDLLSDLRSAVESAIAEGTTLETFRREFDAIVGQHGWSYRGGRDWRTEVIYGTNLRTSYAAGRYQQMKAVAGDRPYWRYRHSDASENPRHQHQAWDGLVLRHTDGWWDTHYPPNGWGCKCYVETLDEDSLERLGKSGPDAAPDPKMRAVRTREHGPDPRTVLVPEGVDPGWAYAPGQAASLGPAVRRYLESSARREPGVAAAGVAATLARERALQALAGEWRDWRRAGSGRGRGAEAFTVGAITRREVEWLKEKQGIDVATAPITVTRRELAHATRASKVQRGAALDEADVDRLPEIFARPEAVLHDEERQGELLYVFTPTTAAGKGKVVVRVSYADRLKLDDAERRASVTTNSVRSAGYVQAGDLPKTRFERIRGAVE